MCHRLFSPAEDEYFEMSAVHCLYSVSIPSPGFETEEGTGISSSNNRQLHCASEVGLFDKGGVEQTPPED